jgi:hypothetical protein
VNIKIHCNKLKAATWSAMFDRDNQTYYVGTYTNEKNCLTAIMQMRKIVAKLLKNEATGTSA